ncbi:MAG: tetratricopeptide repeat protein [Thiotrichales bacterium]
MNSLKPLVFALFASLPLTLLGQKIEPSQNVLSYDWFVHESPSIRIDALDAIDLYAKRYESNPTDPVALNNLGIAYAINGDHASALFLLVRAVSLDPNNRQLHDNLASLRARTKVVWQQSVDTRPASRDLHEPRTETTTGLVRTPPSRVLF